VLKFRYNSSANDDDDDDDAAAAADDNDNNKMWLFRSAFRVYIYTAVGKNVHNMSLLLY